MGLYTPEAVLAWVLDKAIVFAKQYPWYIGTFVAGFVLGAALAW